LPDTTTDASGHLHLDVPVADSITTWRLTALASTQDGRLGSATRRLRVFQDFFVDLNLPAALTVGDEVAVPVGVFNYLPASQTVRIPAEAISGTQALTVKIYPGLLSQVVEGLDNILRMPSGCFEQTSSTTYPNVLVLDYLKTTNHASPETQLKAEEYINLGYQ